METNNPQEPDIFGAALRDYYNSNYTDDIVVHSSLTEDDEIPVPYLFREFDEMPVLEKKALELAKGKVLDIGSGAGSHSLYLQKKGLNVTGLDSSAGALKVAKERGLKKVVCSRLLDYKEGTYDTLLVLMNGTGIFERIKLAGRYLQHLKMLLNPKGQILIDSSDISFMYEEEDGSYWRDASRDYYGEVTFSLSYKSEESPPFDWLYLDFKTLKKLSEENGFKCDLVAEGEHYDYLARLTKT